MAHVFKTCAEKEGQKTGGPAVDPENHRRVGCLPRRTGTTNSPPAGEWRFFLYGGQTWEAEDALDAVHVGVSVLNTARDFTCPQWLVLRQGLVEVKSSKDPIVPASSACVHAGPELGLTMNARRNISNLL